jgi:hypothetical protein
MTNYAKDHVPNWSRRPNVLKMDLLIEWVRGATVPITAKNFRRWLVELAYEHDDSAACSNGKDHACNRGLGEWLGIEAYGQGVDGSVPWDKQMGYSSERLNRFVDPLWQAAVVAAPLQVQKLAYIQLLTDLRDKGEYIYSLPLVGAQDFADLEVSG